MVLIRKRSIFKVSESNGVYKLNPESGFTIDGMYINGVLTMTLKTDKGYTLILVVKKKCSIYLQES